MSDKGTAPKRNRLSRLFSGMLAEWRSFSTVAKVAITGSWVGISVIVGGTIYLTRGTGVPLLLFYFVIVSVGLLTGLPAYRMAKRVRAIARPVLKPVQPKPESEEPEEEKPGALSRLGLLLAKPVKPKTRVYVVVGSTFVTLMLVFIATFVYPSYQARPTYDNYMILILIIGLAPPSFVDLVDRRYRSMIDLKIPEFLREIGESQRTGTPFEKSLMNASESNYGPLSEELRKSMSKMSWGMTYPDALDDFAHTVNTPLAHRTSVLLKEVGRSGGQMLEVLDQVYEHVRELTDLQKERSKQLTPYVMVIYASFGVYLFVVYILFSTFFAQVANLQASGAPFGSNINASVYYIWFFHLSVIEGVFGGLVVGKISAGSSIGGSKHILLLLAVSLIFFTFFVKY